MMSSKGPDAGLRVPRRGKRRSGPMQYVMFGVVAVVVVIVVVVVLAAGRKPAATAGRLPKSSRSSDVEGGRQTRRTAKSGTVRSTAAERRSRRERPRRERDQYSRRTERRRSTTYSSRSSSPGSYSTKRSGPPVVKAIGTDPGGTHYALVGERYVRNGDEIEGRKILEVSGSGVKVQYATKTYTVGVNQPLY